jgi:hypothetical protein
VGRRGGRDADGNSGRPGCTRRPPLQMLIKVTGENKSDKAARVAW